MSRSQIELAKVRWNEAGTPVSDDFDDVYFSNHDGLAETQYVFIEQNQLAHRWKNHNDTHFVIAETGFGTGLNFLATWQAFESHCEQYPDSETQSLHFISIEKYPLGREDLAKAHKAWPSLSRYAEELLQHYPIATAGCHRIFLANGKITLDLWFGDIQNTLPEIWSTDKGIVDCWFLDGFAPSKNPDMWNHQVFTQMAQLAKSGCHLATFTAAGFVRRGLSDVGFVMNKVKGYGNKREMLVGIFPQRSKNKDSRSPLPTRHLAPWFLRQPASSVENIAVIGGGIASACLVLSLIQKGKSVTLYCQDPLPAQGASGNRQGAVYPLLGDEHDALTRFFAPAFVFARHFIQHHASDIEFDHDWCGVTHLAWSERVEKKLNKMVSQGFPDQLITPLTADDVNALTGLNIDLAGISYPLGGWLCPFQLTQAMIKKAESSGKLRCHFNTSITELVHQNDQWLLHTLNNTYSHDCVVIANGHQFTQFEQTAPIQAYPVRGQVSHIDTTPTLKKLKTVLNYEGYLTPVNPDSNTHCIGATYWRNDVQLDFRDTDQVENKQKLMNSVPQTWTKEISTDHQHGRVGIRTASRDHLPFVGDVCDYKNMLTVYETLKEDKDNALPLPCYPNLYCFLALGSRGLTSAPLAAECLASQLVGEPLPLSISVLDALHPARLWVRKLINGRPIQEKRTH